MNKRYLGALFLAPLLIFLYLGGTPLKILMLALSLAGLYEFFKVVKEKQINAMSNLAYIFCILYYFSIGKTSNYKIVTLGIVLFTFIALCIPVLYEKYNFIDVAITIMSLIYIPIFFSFIVLTSSKQYGNYLVWLIFLSSWLCDTSAYYVGRYLGKRKINPRVSPKKTLGGAVGGMLGSTLVCFIYGYYLNTLGMVIPVYHFLIIGVLCGVFCQFGDFVASSIKRFVGVKDYSNLIPGHGGILDRFDSILFSSVIVYYYFTIFIGI